MSDTARGRRRFLRGALHAAGAIAAIPALQNLRWLEANGRASARSGHGGYGALVPAPDLRDGVKRIALPDGFQYRTFSVAGTKMFDGHRVPLGHDGMGAFNMPDGRIRLIRNHEDRNLPGTGSISTDRHAYDETAGGGTTTLVINARTRALERDFVSLGGTIVNCAGGVTPWMSWITCEETSAGTSSGWTKPHGYCFEVPAAANGPVQAVPLMAMGRFSHEAVAVDPATSIVYETEDSGGMVDGTSGSSGFYRFIPTVPRNLAKGGRLQMLVIDGQHRYDARRDQTVGVALPVTWVEIADPNPDEATGVSVFRQGYRNGGARFRRLEGCWWGNGAVYFADTSGGNAGVGAIWEFRPSGNGGTLKLIFESAGSHELDFPDNLSVSPKGALLICEDGGGEQFMRGVTLAGAVFDFARNIESNTEWAGATFAKSSAGITLFVNRQGNASGANPPPAGTEGMTFAIWGPWGDGAL